VTAAVKAAAPVGKLVDRFEEGVDAPICLTWDSRKPAIWPGCTAWRARGVEIRSSCLRRSAWRSSTSYAGCRCST
jgi:hypothetical protein